jgi:hypothetical protein
MTLPASPNSISLNQVNTELGQTATATITMNDSNVRSLAGVGGSGTTITMDNLRGKSRGFNLSYNLYYSSGELGRYGDSTASTLYNPGMTINGYTVYQISSQMFNDGYSYSTLAVNGTPGQYFFNNLYGYDGRSYTPSGASGAGGAFLFYQEYGGKTYWNWRVTANNGGLFYLPTYTNTSGTQLFTYN